VVYSNRKPQEGAHRCAEDDRMFVIHEHIYLAEVVNLVKKPRYLKLRFNENL